MCINKTIERALINSLIFIVYIFSSFILNQAAILERHTICRRKGI